MIGMVTQTVALQIVMAFFGTIAFAVLFGAPRKFYIHCGACGMVGWAVYILFYRYVSFSPAEATFVGTLVVAAISRILAVQLRCPTTIFLITGIFPMVPGGGIYWTLFYLVTGQYSRALSSGGEAIMVTIAIVFAIVVINELPGKWFRFSLRKRPPHKLPR